jgi:hypothetical protein
MRAIVNVNHREMQGRDHKVHEIVGNRVTLECVLEHETILVDFNITEVELLKTFKDCFIQGSTAKAKEDMSKKRYAWARTNRHAVELVTTSGGGYVVGDDTGRNEVLNDMYSFDKNFPTARDTEKVYDMCIEAGLEKFSISWLSDIRFWETHQDKFNREFPEHGDDGTETTMLKIN